MADLATEPGKKWCAELRLVQGKTKRIKGEV
jgi:hypothetical protein